MAGRFEPGLEVNGILVGLPAYVRAPLDSKVSDLVNILLVDVDRLEELPELTKPKVYMYIYGHF